MIAIPALDLRAGACVQLDGNSYDHELIRIPDPVGVALAWREYGFHHLHVVDLDALSDHGNNEAAIDMVIGSTDAQVQVGGGIRSRDSIERVLEEGAQRVVTGARALEDPDWLEEMATTFAGQIVVAVDVRDRKVLSGGWSRSHSKLALDVAEELAGLPLAGLLITIVNRDPVLYARDLALLEDITEAIDFPLFAAGSLGSVNDLRAVADRGAAAAIVGAGLYTGAMNPRAIAEEFAE